MINRQARGRHGRGGGGKVGRRAVSKNGNASFCETCESCETESAVRRLGGYQKMETKFQGAAEIKTREGAAARRDVICQKMETKSQGAAEIKMREGAAAVRSAARSVRSVRGRRRKGRQAAVEKMEMQVSARPVSPARRRVWVGGERSVGTACGKNGNAFLACD